MNIEIITSIIDYAPQLFCGALKTLNIWFLSAFIGILIGSTFGICSCNKIRIKIISQLIDKFTFILRAIPFYVQLLIVYFVLPEVLNINLSPFFAGTLSLGFCSAGYVCQIVRTGINSIPNGQWEAGYVLGYNWFYQIKKIILPQMLKNVAPALSGELDQLLKSTSILSAIGFLELTRIGMNIIAREMNPASMYLIIACIYLIMSLALNLTTKKIEQKLSY